MSNQTDRDDKSPYAADLERLRTTFQAHQTRPLAWRVEQLRSLGAAIAANEARIIEALRSDLGKPTTESQLTEVDYLTKECKLAIRKCESWMKPRPVKTPLASRPARSMMRPEPLGVVLIIGAWNYPIQEVFGPLIGAIAAGNCAVLKPSDAAPSSSRLISEISAQALDAEAFVVVEGGASETSSLLDLRFDKIFYTGGGRVGRLVMRAASEHLTPVTLELGGKSPAIVAADADLDVTARRLVWGAFMNAGQLCVRPDYCMVEANVYEAFLVKLREVIKAFYGQDAKQSEHFARIVNRRHLDRLSSLLDNEKVIIGGQIDRDSLYLAPTVLRDVEPDAPVMQEEIFGPILPTFPVASMEEAIEIARKGPKPLAVYGFTKSDKEAENIIERTSSGTLMINDCVIFQANHHLPFGGVGESGMGRFHGQHTFETFSHLKAIMKRPFWGDAPLRYPPYTEWKSKLLRMLMK